MTLLASLMLPVLSAFAKSDLPIQVESDQVDATLEQKAVFTGNVQIVQGGLRLKADHGIYDKQKNQVEVSGAVEVETEKGHRYQAQSASFNLDNKSGYAVQPSYQIPITPELTARGCAKRVDFADEEHAVIEAGNYTTCEGLDPDWYLAAEKIELDQTSDTGYASQGRLYFKGVPILGSPYISFPLSSARKSGFLPPIFTATSKSGFSVSVPYYWNIAPQYDMTFYPRIITRRGLQLGINGRYLNEKYLGETNLEFLPNDQKTQTTRYALSSKHQQILSDKTGFNWNINLASDDSYADDFARSITDSSQRQLLRDFQAYYNGSESHASLRLSNYQVLQDLNAPVARPYDRLPQLQWGITKYSEDAHWQASLNTEYTRFWHPTLVRGDRVLANLQTSYSWLSPAWFLTPKFSVYTAQYNLSGNNAGLAQTTFSRALPSFSIDTGWFFERPIQWRGKAYSQTLEPRLFYVYTPYKDQKQFPNFDSGEADFNFAQIFSDNIFTGSDRIADANQLTVGITSRLIDDEKGDEQMRFAFAQRYYFADQKVYLTTPRNQTQSDILLLGDVRLSNTLHLEAGLQYNTGLNELYRAYYAASWQPAPKRVLNAEYRYLRGSAEQIDISAQWPLSYFSPRWYGVARVNYSLPDRRTTEGVVGLEYKANCWIARTVLQRFATTTATANTALFVQLELNGLSKIGKNPLDILKRNVRGYQVVE